MMTLRSLICLLENENGGKLQKLHYATQTTVNECGYKILSKQP
jgi:hypothetical protein